MCSTNTTGSGSGDSSLGSAVERDGYQRLVTLDVELLRGDDDAGAVEPVEMEDVFDFYGAERESTHTFSSLLLTTEVAIRRSC